MPDLPLWLEGWFLIIGTLAGCGIFARLFLVGLLEPRP